MVKDLKQFSDLVLDVSGDLNWQLVESLFTLFLRTLHIQRELVQREEHVVVDVDCLKKLNVLSLSRSDRTSLQTMDELFFVNVSILVSIE